MESQTTVIFIYLFFNTFLTACHILNSHQQHSSRNKCNCISLYQHRIFYILFFFYNSDIITLTESIKTWLVIPMFFVCLLIFILSSTQSKIMFTKQVIPSNLIAICINHRLQLYMRKVPFCHLTLGFKVMHNHSFTGLIQACIDG